MWDNPVDRTGSHWSQPLNDTPATYTNNKRAGWTYDANGMPTLQDSLQTVYDATGRTVKVVDTEARGGYQAGLTVENVYDADGRRVKQTETSQWVSNPTPRTTETYYLTSSVLGGRVVAEMSSDGRRVRGYVYSPTGDLIASQEHNRVNGTENRQVYWKHVAPLTGRQARSPKPGMGWWMEVEPDPLGVDAGIDNPYLNQPDEYQSPDLLTPRFGDISDMRTGCTLDGFAVSCDMAMRLMDVGAAQQCPRNYCGATTIRVNGQYVIGNLTTDPRTGQLGYRYWNDGYRRAQPPDDGDIIRVNNRGCQINCVSELSPPGIGKRPS